MQKIILVTDSTDGIGLATARVLVSQGCDVLLHGRRPAKLQDTERVLSTLPGGRRVESYVADLSCIAGRVESLAKAVADRHVKLDVLIKNAGVYHIADPVTKDGLDVWFAVDTITPYLLTQRFLPMLGMFGWVINVSSAAQSSVDPEVLAGQGRLSIGTVYAQSKLALTMWSRSYGAFAQG